MRVICDETNNPPEAIAKGFLQVDLVPESTRDLAALLEAKRRDLLADPSVIDVRLDPEDPTKLIVTRVMEPQLDAVVIPEDARRDLTGWVSAGDRPGQEDLAAPATVSAGVAGDRGAG